MRANVFDEVVSLTEPYLGPTAHRFIARQVAFHLSKAPERLEVGDLPKLAEWVTATLSLLTDDRELLKDYSQKMERLASRS
jgi:hypothetical protein